MFMTYSQFSLILDACFLVQKLIWGSNLIISPLYMILTRNSSNIHVSCNGSYKYYYHKFSSQISPFLCWASCSAALCTTSFVQLLFSGSFFLCFLSPRAKIIENICLVFSISYGIITTWNFVWIFVASYAVLL